MDWRALFRDRERSFRLLAALWAAAAVVPLPVPSPQLSQSQNVLLLGLWLSFLGLAWSLWFKPELSWTLWGITLILALAAFFSQRFVTPLWMSLAWVFWFKATRRAQGLPLLVALGLAMAAPAVAQSKSKERSKIVVPKHLAGYSVNDLVSCGNIDKVPWTYRSDGRATRLLMKDKMTWNKDAIAALWEIFQVMDKQGYVTYVFRRALGDGKYEFIATKDASYERFIEVAGGKRQSVEKANLKNMINRAVLTFTSGDGSTVTYSPGLAGASQLTIQLAQTTGRLLPPIFLRGNYCDRPDLIDENTNIQNAGAPAAKPGTGTGAAPAAGAAK